MLLGELPSDRLLDAYHLQEYKELKQALQAGDVGLLNKALQVSAGVSWWQQACMCTRLCQGPGSELGACGRHFQLKAGRASNSRM